MTEKLRKKCSPIFVWVVVIALFAVDKISSAEEYESFKIGYLELERDARYDEAEAYARIQLRPRGRPFAGAQVGIADAKIIGDAINVEFSLERRVGGSSTELVEEIESLSEEGVHFFLVDLPEAELVNLADRVRDNEVLLLNVTSQANSLRGIDCRSNIQHLSPSYNMLADALVQYLVYKKWTKILLLEGPSVLDRQIVDGAERAAARFGAKIVDKRPFLLSNDPREREKNNVALLTGGRRDYDVVYVADSLGEFGRYVPYQTNRPRPVVGTAGLVADWWSWSWERYGGPQLNSRFEQHTGRRMVGYDWSAWVGVKSLVQAVTRSGSTDFQAVADYLRGDRIKIDGVKGPSLSFRPWNNQLRQPILIGTHNAIIARAPLRGFLHETNDLDTLGDDVRDTMCQF